MLLYSCIVCTFTSMILNSILQYEKTYGPTQNLHFHDCKYEGDWYWEFLSGPAVQRSLRRFQRDRNGIGRGPLILPHAVAFHVWLISLFMTPKLYFNYYRQYFRPLCICLGDLWKGERCCSNIGSGKHLHPRWKEPPEKEDIFLSNKSAHQKIEVFHSDTQDNAENIDWEKVFESQKVEFYSLQVKKPLEFDELHCSSTFTPWPW